MISKGQIALIVGSIALAVLIYAFGDFVGPEKTPEITVEDTEGFNFGLYKEQLIAKLDAVARQDIEKLEKQLADASSDEDKTAAYNALIAYFEKVNAHVVASVYSRQLAEFKEDALVWEKTGDNFLSVLYGLQLPQPVQLFVMEQARESYQRSLDLDPDNVDASISLATTYLEGPQDGTNMSMQGVSILLGIVEENPDNVRAQLILGRYGIVSSQFDKAIERLEKVVALDSNNTEAYFFLGEAHKGKGDTIQAIDFFEKCKALVEDPQFKQQIDAYIEELKNS